jgi:succinylglutamic semialdehyde dehydrogenase
MKYEIKGDYFNGEFNEIIQDSLLTKRNIIKKFSPADLNDLLWSFEVNYQHVDPIIESAKKGYSTWKRTPLEQRLQVLSMLKQQFQQKKDEIAQAIALETGKPLWESATEANALAGKVDATINHSLKRIDTKSIQNVLPNTDGSVHFKPIGPCLIIGPFNFPCHLANGQILNALISGNSIIFKPSEKTCYSGQLLIECFHAAGFPPGVVNMIQGDGETASRLTKEKSIKGVFFTGSVEVGKKILSATHSDLSKLVALELGGKNTSIVHKDANLDYVMPELIKACFMTTGQRCVSTSLIPIHRSIAENFINKFHQITKKIIIDHPIEFEREPLMGPLIDQLSVDNYLNFMGMAKREGIEEIMRGKAIQKKFDGHYVSPSIHLANRSQMNKSHFLTSELFGPNCTFVTYDEIEEAIEIANGTEFGLAASIFTEDETIFELTKNEIEVGQYNWNRSTVGASSILPFGGVKNSGNYRPAAVSFIDSCVYPQSNLTHRFNTESTPEELIGIMKD